MDLDTPQVLVNQGLYPRGPMWANETTSIANQTSDTPHATARRHTVGPGDSKHTQVCFF